MKKLLFTLAVAGAMAAGADEIASANVVGFDENTANNNFTPWGATFFNVGEDVLNLQTVTTTAKDNSLQLWIVNKDLGTVQKAYWWNAWGEEPAAWMDIDGGNELDVDLARGTGVLLKTGEMNVKAKVSGEVVFDNVENYSLNNNFTIFVNPYPVGLPINKITATAKDNSLQMWVVNKDLGTVQKIYWWNAWGNEPAAWMDIDGGNEIEYTIPAGSGVLLKTGETTVKLNAVSPIAMAN